MLTLASITGVIAWVASHAWALILLAVPAILQFLQPFIQAIGQGAGGFAGTVWEGLKTNKFANWMAALVLVLIAGAVGYHYGWQAAIDWGHEHYRWIAKKAVQPHWWKLW